MKRDPKAGWVRAAVPKTDTNIQAVGPIDENPLQLESPKTFDELLTRATEQATILEKKYLRAGGKEEILQADRLAVSTLRELIEISRLAVAQFNRSKLEFIQQVLGGVAPPINECLNRFDPDTNVPKVNTPAQKEVAEAFIDLAENFVTIWVPQTEAFGTGLVAKQLGLHESVPQMIKLARSEVEKFDRMSPDEKAVARQVAKAQDNQCWLQTNASLKMINSSSQKLREFRLPIVMAECEELANGLATGRIMKGELYKAGTDLMKLIENFLKAPSGPDHMVAEALPSAVDKFVKLMKKDEGQEFLKKLLELDKIIAPAKRQIQGAQQFFSKLEPYNPQVAAAAAVETRSTLGKK